MNVNRQQLLYIAPHAGARVSNVLPHLNECAKQYEINTPLRMAHFLAQVCHESGLNGFKEREKYLLRAKKALGI